MQLLTERKLGFSFCLNRNQVLALCGITIMYSALDYNHDGGLRKDSQKLICAVVDELKKEQCFATKQFRLIAQSFVPIASPVMDRRESISSAALDYSASPSSTSSQDEMLSMHGGSPTFRHLPADLSPRQPQKHVRRSSSQEMSPPARHQTTSKYSNRLTSASLTDLNPSTLQQYSIKQNQNSSPMVGNVELYDATTWPIDTSQPPEEWTQLVGMLDSAGAAHIYGEFVPGGGLVPVPQSEWQHANNNMLNSNNLSGSFFQEFEDGVPSVGSMSNTDSDGEQHFADDNELLWAAAGA